MIKRRRSRQLLFFCCLVGMIVCLAKSTLAIAGTKKGKIKVDHLALAAVLLRDGHLQRAMHELKQVRFAKPTPKTKETKKATAAKKAKRARYHMLLGIVQLKLGLTGASVRSLEAAIGYGLKRPLLYLLLAQGHFRLARYHKALRALSRAPASATSMPGVYLLKSQSLWRLRKRHLAYGVLVDGYQRHPTVHAMLRLQALLLIELKLSRAGYRKVQEYLRTLAPLPKRPKKALHERIEVFLMFAGSFRKQKLWREAKLLLEEARLRSPGYVPTMIQLARVYLESGKPRSAASLLERAAWRKPSLMIEAAELYRRAGQHWRALYLNAQIVQQKKKIRQRLGLLIELQRFEEAVALMPRLSRLGLLREQAVVYALSYACYKTGHYKLAERWLLEIKEPGLFRKAMQLRQAMQSCAKRQWWCP